MTNLSAIKKQPTSIEKVHESCYRSFHILNNVLGMIERGDSKETIFEVVEHLRADPIEQKEI